MKQFKANLPDLPTHIGEPALPKHSNREPTWLVLAVSILPSVLPVLVERIGHEISTYFKRKRIKKSKKKKEKKKKEKKKNSEGKQEGEEVLEMTEDEFLAHLESGRIRIVSNDGEPIDFDDDEGESDAEAGDDEEE